MAVDKFNVSGLVCDGCVDTITKLVSKIDGVNSIDLQLKSGKAVVDYDANRVTVENIHKAVKEAGFGVELVAKASA